MVSDWTEPVCQAVDGMASRVLEWDWSDDAQTATSFDVRQWQEGRPDDAKTWAVHGGAWRANPSRRHWSSAWVDAPGPHCWVVRAVIGVAAPDPTRPKPISPSRFSVKARPLQQETSVPLSVVQRVNNPAASTGSSLVTPTFGSNPVAGNLIAVAIQRQQSGVAVAINSVQDTLGNNYVLSPMGHFDNHPGGISTRNIQSWYYAKNIAGGGPNAVTVSFASNVSYSTITAFEIAGADKVDPYLTGGSDTAGSGTTFSTGSLSISLEAIVLAIFESDQAGNTSTTPTPFSGFTQNQADALKYIWDTYRIVSADVAAGATIGAAHKFGILGVAFKAAVAGAPPLRRDPFAHMLVR